MKIKVPPLHLSFQQILILCPTCEDLMGLTFKGDPGSTASVMECQGCHSKWSLQIEILDHNPKIDKALREGGMIILPPAEGETK